MSGMWGYINWWTILFILVWECCVTVYFVTTSRRPYCPPAWPFIAFNWAVGLCGIAINVPMVQAWWP